MKQRRAQENGRDVILMESCVSMTKGHFLYELSSQRKTILMSRFLIIVLAALQVFAMLWIWNGAASTVAAAGVATPSGGEVSDSITDTLELEMLETGGDLSIPPSALSNVAASAHLTDVHIMSNYATVTDLLPRVIISKGVDNLAEGYYFVTTFGVGHIPSTTSSLMIVNDKAQLVYYLQRTNGRIFDFKRLDNGSASYFSMEAGGFNIIDNTYAVSDIWMSGNGFGRVDFHELELLSNGNVAFMIYDFQPLDLTPYGGQADAEVIDLVIQEMDPDHNVIFEWNSRDHFAITDTFVSLTADVVDYAHGNAIEEDTDGNLLISNRHMSEITKIDRETGAIIWRLGGKNNEFTFVNDTTLPDIGGFSYQHDIRRLPNGHITIFDNGNQFIDAAIRGSRGVEYEIDEVSKIVTMTQEFRTIPETYSTFMGNIQRLSNGNTVVGWGGGVPPPRNQPIAVTEFSPAGEVILELGYLDSFNLTYRGFKFPWQGFPTTDPLLVVMTDTTARKLYYSWNGATEVVSYTVLGGQTPQSLITIAQQPKTDFEDSTSLESVAGDLCFFQVIPSMREEAEARSSNIVYAGESHCTTGLATDNSQTASRAFTYTQSTGNVTTTLTLLPGDFTDPTVFIHTADIVGLSTIPVGQYMSNVRFTLTAFEGKGFSKITSINGETLLKIDYGALDLSRNPADVNLLRWDEATQGWTTDGLTLLERETVGESSTYALHQTGMYALFVTNEAPQSAPVNLLIDEDETLNFAIEQIPYFDLDGDALTNLVITTLPVSGSLTLSGTPVVASLPISVAELPLLSFAPGTNEYGLPYTSFEYRVSDAFTQSVPYTLTIAVRPVNDDPVATDDQALFADRSAATISIDVLANDFDVDGDRVQIVSVTAPEHGMVSIADGVIVYTATATYGGSDSFTYMIADEEGAQATASVAVQDDPDTPHLTRLPRIGNE